MQPAYGASRAGRGTEANPLSWVNVVAGALLFIAPWVLDYSDETAAYVNHLVLGAVIVAVALLAAAVHRWWDWVNVVGAAYTILASFWFFSYDSDAAVATSVILGAIVGVVALASATARRSEV
jgi:hypothetical protein